MSGLNPETLRDQARCIEIDAASEDDYTAKHARDLSLLADQWERDRNEIERLRARTKEIQQQEMAKRAALDSELAERRNAYQRARKWTEDKGLTAEWAADPSSPFWSMTSTNNRDALGALFLDAERDQAEIERLKEGLRKIAATHVHEVECWSNPNDPTQPMCGTASDPWGHTEIARNLLEPNNKETD